MSHMSQLRLKVVEVLILSGEGESSWLKLIMLIG